MPGTRIWAGRGLAALAAVLAWGEAPHASADEPPPGTRPRKPIELRIAELANVTFNGIQAGWLIGGAIVSSPRRLSLDFPEYVVYQQDFIKRSNPVGPILMPVATVANIVHLVLLRREWTRPPHWLAAFGLLCNVGVIIAAAAGNGPANSRINAWSATQVPPADWTSVRRRWEAAQTTRMVFSTLAFTSNAAAALLF